MAECIFFLVLQYHLALDRHSSLRNSNNSVGLPCFFPSHDKAAYLLNIIRHLRYKKHMRPSCHACMQSKPSCMPSHDLNNENPAVARCCCVQTIYCFSGSVNCRIKSESVICCINIIVYCLWHSNDLYAVLMELPCHSQCIFPAYCNDAMDFKLL